MFELVLVSNSDSTSILKSYIEFFAVLLLYWSTLKKLFIAVM